MRIALLLTTALLVAPASGALAQDAKGVAAAFGNTVKSTYPDGRNQHLWFKDGGVWDAIGRRGKPSSGTWTVKGEKVCLKQVKPFKAPMTFCTAFPSEGGVGAKWTSKDLTGQTVQVQLVKGIQRP